MNRTKVKQKNRKSLSVAQKLDIIKRLENGERSRDVCAVFNLSSSTVRTIYLQKDKLQEVAQTSAAGAYLHRITKSRDGIIEQVEKYLVHWMDSLDCNNSTLPYAVIQEKALSLFKDLKKKAEEEGHPISADFDFKASHGWFERFRKRANLGSIRASGTDKAKSDVELTQFPFQLQKIIDDHGYSPKQIFNLTETGLFWNRMPCRTFISIEEKQTSGYKVSNERLSLLFGGNLEGDLKLKPLLVYHSENPKALEGIVKTKLPVIWSWNQKSWIDSQVFMHYLSSYFSPLVAKFFNENKLENKVLLILDNSPGHPKNIEDIQPNIQTIFLPQNTAPLLQPMDQGVIATFKAYYLEVVMQYIISGLVINDDARILELWKNYNIKMCINNIALSWEKVTKLHMNACWKNLVSKMVFNHADFKEIIDGIQTRIVQQFKELGFSDINKDDVQDLLASHSNELTNEELFQLLEERPKDLNENQDKMSEVKSLNTDTLSVVFNLANEMCSLLQGNDPNMERSSAFKRGIDELLSGYFDLYKAKKSLIRPGMEGKSEEPKASTSVEHVPKEPEFVDVKVECVLSYEDDHHTGTT